MKSQMILIYSIAILCLLLILSGCDTPKPNGPEPGEEDFTIRFIYVGQADATLITTPQGKAFLYDFATSSGATNYLLPLMDSLHVDEIDMAFASHMHSDHIGGIDEVFESIALTGNCYDHGGDLETHEFIEYSTIVGSNRRSIEAGDTLWLDDMRIICVTSGGNDLSVGDENDKSVCLIITYNGFDLWLGGDLNGSDYEYRTDMESYIASDCWAVECYQANHHGSSYSSNETFMSVLQPHFSVISCGISNPYGHPHDEAVSRMEVFGNVYRTDMSGTITVTIDDTGSYIIQTQY